MDWTLGILTGLAWGAVVFGIPAYFWGAYETRRDFKKCK